MAIDFTLTAEQRELQLSARAFAQKTFGDIAETIRHLPTARERFAATRPAYEEVVTQGWLRKIIPAPAGGEGNGLVDMALIAEEFYAVDANVSLTTFASLLGLLPVLNGGSRNRSSRPSHPSSPEPVPHWRRSATANPAGSPTSPIPPPPKDPHHRGTRR